MAGHTNDKGALEARRVRMIKALDLRIAGATYRQIGKEFGVSYVQAYRDVTDLLAEESKRAAEKADHLRRIELARCEKMTVALWPKVRDGDEKAVSTMVRVMERRAKLLGLDRPTEVRHEGSLVTSDLSALSTEELATRAARLLNLFTGGRA